MKTNLTCVLILSLAILGCTSQRPPPRRPGVPSKVRATPKTYYYTATAQDNHGLESDYSNEVSLTATNTPTVVLAWDPSLGTNVITNYTVYAGYAPRTYTNKVAAATNLTATLVGIAKAVTNRLVAINVATSSMAQGAPWGSVTNWPTIYITNPVVDCYYKFIITERPF